VADGGTYDSTWPVVGRDAELRALIAALDDPECGGVAFIGAAGIGKTRLASLTLELAAERGMVAVAVRATKSGAALPFGALAPLFDEVGLSPELEAGIVVAAAEAIEQRRGDRRMVLVVDDAQELDDASTALLDQLVERSGVFLVFTVRSGGREAAAIVGMWKDEHIVRIEVGPLPERDLRSLAVIAVGGPVDGATLQALVAASGGNVLFLRELVQSAQESGALASELGLWRLKGSLAHSPRLRDLIEQRLTGLSDDEREALELVALADPIPLSLLEQLVPLRAVERLEGRGLVDAPVGENGTELRLNHPLYGEVVRAHLPSIRRTRLCRSLAEAAESDVAPTGRDAVRIAVWQLDGGGAGRLETLLAAGRTALRTEYYELALRMGQAAWDQSRSVEAALVLSDSLDYLGRSRAAEELLGEARVLATNDQELTDLAVRRASALFRSLGEAARADQVLEETAAAISDPKCHREILAMRGVNLVLAGDVRRSIALDEALLREPGDSAFAQASLDLGVGLAMAGRTIEAVTHTQTALAARMELNDEGQYTALGIYLVAQAVAHLHAGNLAEAAGIADAGYQFSVERANVDGQAWFASILALIRLIEGRPATAGNLFREAATLFGTLNHPGRRWGLGGIALATAHLGEHGGETALAELDAMGPTAVHMQDIGIMRGRAWTAAVRGEVTLARTILWEAVELAESWGQHAATAEALHDLVRLGEPTPATERLQELESIVDGPFMEARLLFALAARGADLELAEQATTAFEDIGALLFAAESASLERRLATEAGLMRRAAAAAVRADALLASCEGARTPGLSAPESTAALSGREREVAMLAAQDLTSKEIAERLFVSVRTVDNHLQRAYMKLGVTGRSELAERLDIRLPD
jgi:DNA-binding CsgD family transcriptional regulator